MNEKILDKLRAEVEPEVEALVKEILLEFKDSLTSYSKDLAKDFTLCLWLSYGKNDETAKRNLKHLKVQVQQVAIIHALKLNNKMYELLEKTLEITWKIALKAMIAAAL